MDPMRTQFRPVLDLDRSGDELGSVERFRSDMHFRQFFFGNQLNLSPIILAADRDSERFGAAGIHRHRLEFLRENAGGMHLHDVNPPGGGIALTILPEEKEEGD